MIRPRLNILEAPLIEGIAKASMPPVHDSAHEIFIFFLFLFTAYSIASPAVVSPFEYSILFWSPLVGWLYFDEIPSLNTVVGILIIVSSGVYIFMREKAQNQSIATEKPLR